jgi:hypothetical protein
VVVVSASRCCWLGGSLLWEGWPARANTTNIHNSRLAAERDGYCCTARQLSSRQRTYRLVGRDSGVRCSGGVVTSTAEKSERLGRLLS